MVLLGAITTKKLSKMSGYRASRLVYFSPKNASIGLFASETGPFSVPETLKLMMMTYQNAPDNS